MPRTVKLSIQQGDITEIEADVVILKYAESFHGADQAVAIRLNLAGIDISELQLPVGEYTLVDTKSSIGAQYALFMGTEGFSGFRYQQIMQFAAKTMAILAIQTPDARHIAATTHGANYGLDESEALISQFKGLLEILKNGPIPAGLERITIVELGKGRTARLRRALELYLEQADYARFDPDDWGFNLEATGSTVGKRNTAPGNNNASSLPTPADMQTA